MTTADPSPPAPASRMRAAAPGRVPPPTFPPWVRFGPLLGLAAITLVLAIIYSPVFGGELAGDDNSYHFADAAQIAECVRSGDWDWWSPSANGGYALGYYYQLIPSAVPGLLAAVFGDVLFWFQLSVFLVMVLAPAAAYRGLRVMGAEPWAALGGAVAAACFMGGSKWGAGDEGVFWVGLYTQGWAMCAFPLALGHGWRWIAHGRGAAPAVLWALFVGLCHPVAGVALGVALFAALPVAVAVAWGPQPGWPVARLLGLGVLMIVGSASAWLPVLVDYEGFGGFPHRLPDEVGPGFKLLARWIRDGYLFDARRDLPAVGSVGLFTWLLGPSFFLAVTLFALGRARYLLALWCGVVVLTFILGVGKELPRTDDDLFPAVRVMGMVQVMVAMAVGAALVAGAAWAVRALDRPGRLAIAGQVAVAFVVGVAAIVAIAPMVGKQRARNFVSYDFDRIYRAELDPLMAAMRTARPGRLQNRGGSTKEAPGVENHWFIILPFVYAGVPQLVAYGGAPLQSSPNFFALHGTPEPTRAAWIYDAPLVLTNHERGPGIGGRLVASTEHFELRELPAPGLISAVQVVGELPARRKDARKAVLEWQRSARPLTGQVLAHAGHGSSGPAPDGDAHDVRRAPSEIHARLVARAPTTFLVRESWHPRWVATVDGRAVPIRRVSPDMMAVDVAAGEHQLALSFERPWWVWALWLLIPMVALAGWGIERWITRVHGAAAARA